jgi:hypothetical protein
MDKINLTDMWKAQDGKTSQKPKHWLGQNDTINFLKSLAKKVEVAPSDLVKTRRGGKGGGGGTFAHWQIALAYAKYLSPEFHIWCNEVVKLHIEYDANPEKGMSDYKQKCIDKWVEEGKSPEWIKKRLKGQNPRKELISN